MKTQHTKGPWHIYKADYPMITDGNIDIARVNDEANARLIASAPELLEALKSFVEIERDEHYAEQAHDEQDCAFCLAIKAINKAEGN